MSKFDELKKKDRDRAALLDMECFMMAPRPLAADASDEEREAFFAQIDEALEVSEAEAEKILENET